MKITEVKIRKTFDEGALRAIVSVTIDDVFAVHDIKIINGSKGMYVAMPCRKCKDGEFRDVAHPLNTEIRTYFNDTILKKYNEIIATEE